VNLKISKIKVKVRGKKETIYEYLSAQETAANREVMDEFMPRRMKRPCMEPNPNSLRFPKEERKIGTKKKKKEASRRKQSHELGSVCLT
jgi:hypothetical protein